MLEKIKNSNFGLRLKINTLEGEIEELKDIIKNDLYKYFIEDINRTERDKRLIEENKMLRRKIKKLKEEVKENEIRRD